jgi:NRAMP (natural resistance-associated macrophage protein)-like metal ion transporter
MIDRLLLRPSAMPDNADSAGKPPKTEAGSPDILPGSQSPDPGATQRKQPQRKPRWKKILRILGPGLVTGAADDDPSGIATYSEVGAVAGFGLGWTVVLTTPLMVSIQAASARIGSASGEGLAANIRKRFPPWVVYGVLLALLGANVFNAGADLYAMGAVATLVAPGPVWAWTLGLAGVSVVLQIVLPYRRYLNALRWLALSLLAYVVVALVAGVDWAGAIRMAFVPSVPRTPTGLELLLAVLGTTLSPYLFFWQSSLEAEETTETGRDELRSRPRAERRRFARIDLDTIAGMIFSNLIAFFIIVASAATLHAHGGAAPQAPAQVALALRPVAGPLAGALFAFGIVSCGLLAAPTLVGSIGYATAEIFGKRPSLNARIHEAPLLYGAIIVSMAVGILLVFAGIGPIQALVYSAEINGLATAPLMVIIMWLAERTSVVGQVHLPWYHRLFGWLGTALMACAGIAGLVAIFAPSLV